MQDLEENKSKGTATLTIITLGKTTKEIINTGSEPVLNLLIKNHKVSYTRTGSIISLNCIDEVCAKNGFWWKFLVNDKLTLNSVDKYYPKKGDIIKLEYGEA